MTFLRVNGWRIPVRDRGASEELVTWGEVPRSRDGRPLRHRRAVVRDPSFNAIFMLEQDANALVALLEGRGHHFPFNIDAHSESGLGPDTPAAGAWSITYRTLGANGILGAGFLTVTTSIVWDAQLPRGLWTILYWRNVNSTSTAEHVAVRADGAKWLNGVRNDALVTTELVVDEDLGAVALTAGDYDDLVLLPWHAPDSFVEDFYRWTTEKHISLHVPVLDGTPRDTIGLILLPPTLLGGVSVVRTGGRVGGCIIADAAGEAVSLFSAAETDVFGKTEITFEAWVYPLAATPAGTVAAHIAGGAGWRLDLLASTPAGRVGVRARVHTATGTAEHATAPLDRENSLVPGTWNHVLFTWVRSSGRVALRVNGRSVPRVAGSFTDQPGSAPLNDGGAATYLGNDSTLAVPANARLSGIRFYRLALTDDEAIDAHRAGLEGVPGQEPRPFSALPRVVLDGAAVGYRPRAVVAEVTDQPYVQHGQKAGVAACVYDSSDFYDSSTPYNC
jgi:hypothetical protein